MGWGERTAPDGIPPRCKFQQLEETHKERKKKKRDRDVSDGFIDTAAVAMAHECHPFFFSLSLSFSVIFIFSSFGLFDGPLLLPVITQQTDTSKWTR